MHIFSQKQIIKGPFSSAQLKHTHLFQRAAFPRLAVHARAHWVKLGELVLTFSTKAVIIL